jgi:hypothetical protein
MGEVVTIPKNYARPVLAGIVIVLSAVFYDPDPEVRHIQLEQLGYVTLYHHVSVDEECASLEAHQMGYEEARKDEPVRRWIALFCLGAVHLQLRKIERRDPYWL